MLVVALAFCSCESCQNDNTDDNAAITWNINVAAKGEGVLGVTYPTGRLDLNGAASFTAVTTNDSLLNVALENAPCYHAVLADTAAYSAEQVYLAKQVESAFNVDTISGTWAVDITGYARYSNIYIVIDEHFPRTACCTEVAPCDSMAVEVAE